MWKITTVAHIHSIFLCADSIVSLANGFTVSLSHFYPTMLQPSSYAILYTHYVHRRYQHTAALQFTKWKANKKEKKCVHTVSACMKLSPRSHSLARVLKIFMIPLSPIILAFENRTNCFVFCASSSKFNQNFNFATKVKKKLSKIFNNQQNILEI